MPLLPTRLAALLRATQTSRLAHQLALGAGAVVSMAAAVSSVRPVYVGRAPGLDHLVAVGVATDSVASRAPWAGVADVDSAIHSARFEIDRLAFVQDLLHTGRIDSSRAEVVGTVAVREAYKRRLPPALVFGVLLTENRDFRSTARSGFGAVGLMQVVPRVWVPTLAKLFGRNLTRDETNLQYGVHILSGYLYRSAERVETADKAVIQGLMRYNGCTPGRARCQHYPNHVRQMVEQYATAQCGVGGYEGCVSRPLRISMRDATGENAGAAEQVATR